MNGTLNALIYSIKNPLTFIYANNTLGDWYTNDELYQHNSLWSNSQSAKSDYDPCPPGWRIPVSTTWNDYVNSTAPPHSLGHQNSATTFDVSSGRLYANLAWLPASGSRHYIAGELYSIASGGYYWSYTVSTNIIYLFFNMDVVNLASAPKACGYPVRCVQE